MVALQSSPGECSIVSGIQKQKAQAANGNEKENKTYLYTILLANVLMQDQRPSAFLEDLKSVETLYTKNLKIESLPKYFKSLFDDAKKGGCEHIDAKTSKTGGCEQTDDKQPKEDKGVPRVEEEAVEDQPATWSKTMTMSESLRKRLGK